MKVFRISDILFKSSSDSENFNGIYLSVAIIALLHTKCKHCFSVNNIFAHVREKEGVLSVQSVEKSGRACSALMG